MGTAYWTPYHLILEKIPICAFYLVVKDHKKQHGKTYIFLTMLLIISILSRLTLILMINTLPRRKAPYCIDYQ